MQKRKNQLKNQIVVMISRLDNSERIHRKEGRPNKCLKGSNWNKLGRDHKKQKETQNMQNQASETHIQSTVCQKQRFSQNKRLVDHRRRYKTESLKYSSIFSELFSSGDFRSQKQQEQNNAQHQQCFNPDALRTYISQLDVSAKFNRFSNILKHKYCQFSRIKSEEETLQTLELTQNMKKCFNLVRTPTTRQQILLTDEEVTSDCQRQYSRQTKNINMHRRVFSALPKQRQARRAKAKQEKQLKYNDSFQVKKIKALQFEQFKNDIKLPREIAKQRTKCCNSFKESLRVSQLKNSSDFKQKTASPAAEGQNTEMRGWEIDKSQTNMKEENWQIFY